MDYLPRPQVRPRYITALRVEVDDFINLVDRT
jgi:hypothetical protein